MYVSKPISSLQYYLVRKSHRNELFYDLFSIRQLGNLFFTQKVDTWWTPDYDVLQYNGIKGLGIGGDFQNTLSIFCMVV